jgi:hypothetical protein
VLLWLIENYRELQSLRFTFLTLGDEFDLQANGKTMEAV